MRERSGSPTEHATRKPHVPLALAALVTAGLTLAPVSGAATVGHRAPGTPGAPRSVAPTVTPAATTDSDVREIDVPRAAADPSARGAEQVARLVRRHTVAFEMVGVTWRPGSAPGDLAVEVRAHDVSGWSGWQDVHVEPQEGPAPEEDSGVRAGTTPLWVGPADGVDVRVSSASGKAPADLQLALVDPGTDATTGAAPAVARSASPGAGSSAVQAAPAVARGSTSATEAAAVSARQPRVISRRGWGADPRLRSHCDSPRRANTVQMVFVHHTVGSNDYQRSDSRAIVRGIYAYHTQSRGWCDIGYNFLVDRFGRVFEGRAGGINTPVRGAHAGDYNVRTVGISLMGNFQNVSPTPKMKRGLTRVVAWKLGSYYRYPKTTARIAGTRFKKISGHRDAMSTACPGQRAYDWLPRLRNRVANRIGNVETPISRKWHRLRRNGTKLGQPFRGETSSAAGGRKTQFAHGWVFWQDGPGAHSLRGPIFQRFRRLGQAGGRLGYPRTDTWPVKGHRGRGQAFQHGRVYRTPGNGAVGVWGRVNRRYAKAGLADGRLGVPVRTQYRTGSGWAADFQHGRITWNTSTSRTNVTYQ